MVVKGFAGVIEAEGLLDVIGGFALERRAFELDAEGFTEDFDEQ